MHIPSDFPCKRDFSLSKLSPSLDPFLPVLALAVFAAWPRISSGLHTADAPHLPWIGAACAGVLEHGTRGGSLEVRAKSHLLPTISFLLWALPHAKTQSED